MCNVAVETKEEKERCTSMLANRKLQQVDPRRRTKKPVASIQSSSQRRTSEADDFRCFPLQQPKAADSGAKGAVAV